MTKKKSDSLRKHPKPEDIYAVVKKTSGIIGRQTEVERFSQALLASRNVLIEGPVGVGKTVLAQAVATALGRRVIRVDGDSRFTEQKLTGWFDPSLVIKRGFSEKTFIAGPLTEAMRTGSILFINELNRMPEAVQNVLLPAIDEGILQIPQLGQVTAKPGFLLVATQNPREFVATSHLSEALIDRMEWISLSYQNFEEEQLIVESVTHFRHDPSVKLAVALVRLTRGHPRIKRGASIRAAIAIAQLLKVIVGRAISEQDFLNAVKLALPTRIELNFSETDGALDAQIEGLITELFNEVKKNSSALNPGS